MRHRFRHAVDQSDVNMTPMLDIVFILLVFFIVTATFLQEKGVEMLSPQSGTPPVNPPMTILVQIDADDLVYVNGRLTDETRVAAAIQRLSVDAGVRGTTVALQPDLETRHGVVARVYDAAKSARVDGVSVLKPARWSA